MNKTKKVVMKKEKKLYCEKCLLLVEHKKNHCKYCGARVRKEKVEPFNFKPIAKKIAYGLTGYLAFALFGLLGVISLIIIALLYYSKKDEKKI